MIFFNRDRSFFHILFLVQVRKSKATVDCFRFIFERDRETQVETERQRDRETERQRDRETERQRERETERQRDRETERQRDRETERQRDRETERQRDREAERQGDKEKRSFFSSWNYFSLFLKIFCKKIQKNNLFLLT